MSTTTAKHRNGESFAPGESSGRPFASLDELLERAVWFMSHDRFADARDQLQGALTSSGLPRKAYKRHPSLANVYSKLGQTHLCLGTPHEALRLLETARRRFPSNLSILSLMARAHLQLGSERDALSIARRVLRSDARNTDANIVLAELFRRQGKLKQAVMRCNRALQSDMTRPETYEILVDALERMGWTEEATVFWEVGIPFVPRARIREAWMRLATLARQAGHFQRAEQTLRRLLKYKEGRDEIHGMLSELYAEAQRMDKSVQHARMALRLNPCNLTALNVLVFAHARRGAFGDAIQAASAAVRAAPWDPFQRLKLATLYHQNGDFVNAVKQYEQLLVLHPKCDHTNTAMEAIATIDHFQFQQVMLRAAEDAVFRIKLQRSIESTLQQYGYAASGGLLSLLHSANLIDWGSSSPEAKAVRYH